MSGLRGAILVAAATVCSIAAWAPLACAQAPERVEVEYLQPEKFTDAGRYWGGERGREATLAALARHIRQATARLLPDSQRLKVEITDLDMAGAFEPWRKQAGDARIVRSVYPTRVGLRFRLSAADGSVLKEGARELRDPGRALDAAAYRDDPLRYEKALIDGWLEREFKALR